MNPDLAMMPFDLDKANQILEEAGYLDSDGDGVREGSDGLPLEFRLIYISDFPPALTMSEAIADWLGEIGISVSVEAVDWGTWFDVVTNQRDFDMTIDFSLENIDLVSMDYWHSCWAAEPAIARAATATRKWTDWFMHSGSPRTRMPAGSPCWRPRGCCTRTGRTSSSPGRPDPGIQE